MIESDNKKLPIIKQLKLIGLSSSVYYYKKKHRVNSPDDIEIKSIIQSLNAEQTSGYRVMHGRLQLLGFTIGEKPVRRLMKNLSIRGLTQSTVSGSNVRNRKNILICYETLKLFA